LKQIEFERASGMIKFYAGNCLISKESWPKGPGFGLPLKGAVLLKTVQVKSA
jgi:hypothetical protein